MTGPKHPVAAQRAAPHRGILRPALRISKQALDEAFCDPPAMRQKRQVDVNERIGCSEPLPGQRDTVKAINDTLIPVEEIRVYPHILVMRDRVARQVIALRVLDDIDRIQRQPRYRRQPPGQRRLAATGIAEHCNLSHGESLWESLGEHSALQAPREPVLQGLHTTDRPEKLTAAC